jgi:hypothetical protein
MITIYNSIVLKHKNTSDLREREELEKNRKILKDTIQNFASYLGIPTFPSGITINFKSEGAEIVDWGLIQELLEDNIFGDKVIERLNGLKDFTARMISVGIDETQFEIPASYIMRRGILALGPSAYTAPVYLNAAVATW